MDKTDSHSSQLVLSALEEPHSDAGSDTTSDREVNSSLEPGGSGVIALDAAGMTTFSSSSVVHLLETYFANEPLAPTRLPQALATWLAKALIRTRFRDYKLPAEPLVIEIPLGRLVVRLLDSHSTREEILLLEERRKVSPEMFQRFGLTPRECDVLYWITEGKSDPNIGLMCSISVRTVQKHNESIYRKLGVETRTAALRAALAGIH